MLNGKNSNYSYGSLQQVFELSFRKEKISPENLSKVLILGFGGGSVVEVLREQVKYSGSVKAVEIDEMMLDIGREHFPKAFENTEVVIGDALEFVTHDEQFYDLIIVDLFVDNRALKESYSRNFLHAVHKRLTPGGMILHNLMLKHREMQEAVENYCSVFSEVRHHMLLGTNQVMVAEKKFIEQ